MSDVDLTLVDPERLIGLHILKEFDGFGLCRGVIRSTDRELISNRSLFNMECVDDDTEDLHLDELITHV